MFERAILHLDLDAFFVSVECLHNTALRGKPLIIGGSRGRGVVASCSYEARAFGIHAGMPIRRALYLCPDVLVLRGDMERYSRHSRLITEIIEEEAPLFEKASIDEFYLDLTGMDRHFGCWRWSQELRRRLLHESGLPLSLGLSINKLVAKVGTGEGKPNGARLIEAGKEKDFLAPLPVRKLPGVGPATCERLRHMGVVRVATLRQIPAGLLQRAFGKQGRSLWQKANAIDDRPIVPYRDQKSISAERTFQTDTIDTRFLRDQLTGMATQLAFELRQKQRLTACVTVKIRYTDFNTFTRQRRIPYTAGDRALIQHAHELFDQLYQRRQLVRLIGLRFSELVTGHPQMSLFEDTGEDERLLAAIDKIRRRYGEKTVVRAAALM